MKLFRKYFFKTIFFLILIIVMFNPIKSYFKDISFNTIQVATDSSNRPLYTIGLNYSTRKAFIPHEKIHVKAVIVFTELGKKLYEPEKHRNLIFFNNSYDYNKFYSELDKDDFTGIGNFITENGNIQLNQINNNTFSGKSTIVYTMPGNESLYFARDNPIPIDKFNFNINIGSTVDVMNKRVNDLLFAIAIMTFLLSLKSEFRTSK